MPRSELILRTIAICVALVFWQFVDARGAEKIASSESVILKEARQGQIIGLTNLWSLRRKMPVLPVRITTVPGPQLLFSDRPEYFRAGDGISMQEAVGPGAFRLYVYHVPGPTNVAKVITAVIENRGTNTLKFRFSHRAFPKPSGNYQEIGKRGLMEYFSSLPEAATREIGPAGRMVIDPAMDATVVMSPQLVHGLYEFEIDQPALISVFQRNPEEASADIVERLRLLAPTNASEVFPAGAGRGRFPICNFEVANSDGKPFEITNGPVQLVIADGKRDPWIQGMDGIEHSDTSQNKGNYGAVYRLRLSYRGDGTNGLALLAYNPLGELSGCGHLAMAVRVSKGDFPGGVVAVPAEKSSFGGRGQMVLIQRFPPLAKDAIGTLEIDYSPPGASCLPTPLMLVPYLL